MKSSRRGVALRKLLDTCDDLQRLRVRLAEHDLPRDTRARLARQVRSKTDRLARDLSAYRFRGPLGQLLREFRLEAVHFQVLATLLHRHLRAESPAIEGRLLLASVFDNSFDVLAGMQILHENGVLRMSGLLVVDHDSERVEYAPDSRFRLSDEALASFRDEVAGRRHRRTSRCGDRVLEQSRGARSAALPAQPLQAPLGAEVQQDRWDRVYSSPASPSRQLTHRIESG